MGTPYNAAFYYIKERNKIMNELDTLLSLVKAGYTKEEISAMFDNGSNSERKNPAEEHKEKEEKEKSKETLTADTIATAVVKALKASNIRDNVEINTTKKDTVLDILAKKL